MYHMRSIGYWINLSILTPLTASTFCHFFELLHGNPILCGCIVLDQLLMINEEMWPMMELYICMIGHAYHVLQMEGILQPQEIPALEAMLTTFHSTIFFNGEKPKRENTNGSTKYALSVHMISETDAVKCETFLHRFAKQENRIHQGKGIRKPSNEITLKNRIQKSSDLHALLWHKDLSCVESKYLDKLLDKVKTFLEGQFHDKETDIYSPISLNSLYYIEAFKKIFEDIGNSSIKVQSAQSTRKDTWLEDNNIDQSCSSFYHTYNKLRVLVLQCWFEAMLNLNDEKEKIFGRWMYHMRSIGYWINLSILTPLTASTFCHFFELLHGNPILCGCIVLDQLLMINEEMWPMMELYICMIGHAYHVLQMEGILQPQEIPALEAMITTFHSTIFFNGTKPKRENTNGSTNYALSVHMISETDAAKYETFLHRFAKQENRIHQGKGNRKPSNEITLKNRIQKSSDLHALLWHKDLSCVESKYLDKLLDKVKTFLESQFHDKETEIYSPISLNSLYYIEAFKKIFEDIGNSSIKVQSAQSARKHTWLEDNNIDQSCSSFYYTYNKLRVLVLQCYLSQMESNGRERIEEHLSLLHRTLKSHFEVYNDDLYGQDMSRQFYVLPKDLFIWFGNEFGIYDSHLLKFSLTEPSKLARQITIFEEQLALIIALENEIAEDKKLPPLAATENQSYPLSMEKIAIPFDRYWTKNVLLHKKKDDLLCHVKANCKRFPQIIRLYAAKSKDHLHSLLDHVLFGLWSGYREFADWMLQMWAYSHDVSKPPSVEFSTLHLAVMHEHLWAVEQLLCESNSSTVDEITMTDGNTALHLAVFTGNIPIFTTVVHRNANPGTQNKYGQYPHDFINPNSPNSMKLGNSIRPIAEQPSSQKKLSSSTSSTSSTSSSSHTDASIDRNEYLKELTNTLLQQGSVHQKRNEEATTKKGKSRRKGGDNTTSAASCSVEDFQKANTAEEELLQLLAEEEKAKKPTKKEQKSKKKK